MKNVCVTDVYIDIDGLAAMVAYAELLNKIGEPATAMSRAPFNASIPSEMRTWSFNITNPDERKPGDTYIIVDASEPSYFPSWADNVTEIVDHHPGYEEYWRERIGNGMQIEPIGAAATLIWEKWRDADQLEQMSELSARLIVCAILDQTLDFQAGVTTERDRVAYDDCLNRANFDGDLREWYFSGVSVDIERDLADSIKNDTKELIIPSFAEPINTAQLAVWDGADFWQRRRTDVLKILGKEKWLLNLIDISGCKSQFVTNDKSISEIMTKLTGVQFNEQGIAVAERPWLRKEILKAGIEYAKS
ncbi:DHH family phosphoesterase [Candidatus Saccharibacteria bacterium]|nr:DHH family phosphoesterase [Candidatus Saccharibacteria bacterium]